MTESTVSRLSGDKEFTRQEIEYMLDDDFLKFMCKTPLFSRKSKQWTVNQLESALAASHGNSFLLDVQQLYRVNEQLQYSKRGDYVSLLALAWRLLEACEGTFERFFMLSIDQIESVGGSLWQMHGNILEALVLLMSTPDWPESNPKGLIHTESVFKHDASSPSPIDDETAAFHSFALQYYENCSTNYVFLIVLNLAHERFGSRIVLEVLEAISGIDFICELTTFIKLCIDWKMLREKPIQWATEVV